MMVIISGISYWCDTVLIKSQAYIKSKSDRDGRGMHQVFNSHVLCLSSYLYYSTLAFRWRRRREGLRRKRSRRRRRRRRRKRKGRQRRFRRRRRRRKGRRRKEKEKKEKENNKKKKKKKKLPVHWKTSDPNPLSHSCFLACHHYQMWLKSYDEDKSWRGTLFLCTQAFIKVLKQHSFPAPKQKSLA